ncbi:M48 family metallopeptidase [Leptobacterium sp. I13]|uniref:M48 family metallopeptidase n=1 Tax=Leptobacterium meishanense TaxID=3128904 RepID=UPI0030EF1B56
MKKGASYLLILAFIISCKTNPFTGKKTLNFVSNSQLFPTSFQQYNQVLDESNVIKGTSDAALVKKVGARIASAADRWLTANGYPGYLKDYRWEYNLIKDDQVNAWAMPGGKIAFYTGILPITKTETGLAVVMGHEVAHALADHGAQRMSAGTLQQLVGVGVAAATSEKSAEAQNAWLQAYGIGTQVGVMLPFSRKHESEADAIGIQIMAIAGYNPYEAAELWKRMKVNSGGQAPPEFLSTHPSNETRIQNLTALAPKAVEEAKKFGVTKFQ